MANDAGDSREQGIEFGDLAEDLENETYPVSHEALLEQYGDRELVLVGKSTTLREALSADNEREYENPEGVRQAVFNAVGGEAVGREDYSDRGGNASADSTTDEDESF